MADTLDDYWNFYDTVGWNYDEPDTATVDSTLQAYRDFYTSEGYQIGGPSDPKLAADVLKAKEQADKTGNKKLADTLDFVLKYGDRALSILTKNGIIQNKNLTSAGYTFNVVDDTTSNAPSASSRTFNIDFTDPKVLIICALLLGIIVYLFASISRQKKAKR